ncbi:uncharacterized protein LOC143620730 [Bidens hawaiensis]|uniref:uncharacterized protein LOC143620730 n=1 Tax=Bidens hawaiensis TaxID=980011 RepID=UPI00404A3912
MGSTIQNQNANRGLHNPTAATVAGESSVAANATDVIFPVPEPAPTLASGLGIPPTTRPRSARKRSSETSITSFQMSVGSEPLDWELLYSPTAAGQSRAAAAAADAVGGIFSVQEPPSTSAPGPSAPSTRGPRSARSRRHNARNLSRLERRDFVHSHTAQVLTISPFNPLFLYCL